MSVVAVAVGAGAVVSLANGAMSASAARRGAREQAAAADAATAEQARQYDQTREDFAPWRDAGVNALAKLEDPNGGAFQASPGYDFVRNEGGRGLERSAAARGGAFSGNALRALGEFQSGLASQEYGNWWNRQAGLAGVGQSATGSTALAGMNYANNAGSNMMQAGNARASGIAGQANAWGGALSGLADYGMYRWGGGGLDKGWGSGANANNAWFQR